MNIKTNSDCKALSIIVAIKSIENKSARRAVLAWMVPFFALVVLAAGLGTGHLKDWTNDMVRTYRASW